MIYLAIIVTIAYVLTTVAVLAIPDPSTARQRVGRYLFGTAAVALVWFSTYGYYYMRTPA